jgi:hypothetical protein
MEGLILRAGRDVAVGGQIGEKALDFQFPHRGGMPQVMKANETFAPHGVTFFRERRELPHPARSAQPVEQTRRFGTRNFFDPQTQDFAIKERERRMGRFKSIQGIRLRLCHVLEESAHVGDRELARMPLVVKQDELARLMDIPLSWAILAKAGPCDLQDEIEQLGRRRRSRSRLR